MGHVMWLIAIVLLTTALMFSKPVLADMLTVSGIEIAAKADSAVDAKVIAIAEGQAKAFSQILQRLTSPEDNERLPMPDAQSIQSVVAGFSLDNERTSANEYLAELTVRFNADSVEFLLSHSNIRMVAEQSEPVLIIPVLWQNGSAVIWGEDNKWRSVWQKIDLDNRLVPALIPLGDGVDEQVDQQELGQANPEALSVLAVKYGVKHAVIAIVAYDLEQKLIEAAFVGNSQRGAIDLRAIGVIEEGREIEAMKQIADQLLNRLDQKWREVVASGSVRQSKQTADILVPFSNLKQWVGIRRRLENAPGIQSLDVRSLNAEQAQIMVSFIGDLRELAKSLKFQGLFLYDDGVRLFLRTN